jgi:hypothetical protein
MIFQGWVGLEQKSEICTQSEKIARILVVESIMVNSRALFELKWSNRDGAIGKNSQITNFGQKTPLTERLNIIIKEIQKIQKY